MMFLINQSNIKVEISNINPIKFNYENNEVIYSMTNNQKNKLHVGEQISIDVLLKDNSILNIQVKLSYKENDYYYITITYKYEGTSIETEYMLYHYTYILQLNNIVDDKNHVNTNLMQAITNNKTVYRKIPGQYIFKLNNENTNIKIEKHTLIVNSILYNLTCEAHILHNSNKYYYNLQQLLLNGQPIEEEPESPTEDKEFIKPRPLNTEVELPLNTEVELPLNTEVQLPLNTEVQLPLDTEVQLPLDTEVQLPLNTEVQLPLNTEVRLPLDTKMQNLETITVDTNSIIKCIFIKDEIKYDEKTTKKNKLNFIINDDDKTFQISIVRTYDTNIYMEYSHDGCIIRNTYYILMNKEYILRFDKLFDKVNKCINTDIIEEENQTEERSDLFDIQYFIMDIENQTRIYILEKCLYINNTIYKLAEDRKLSIRIINNVYSCSMNTGEILLNNHAFANINSKDQIFLYPADINNKIKLNVVLRIVYFIRDIIITALKIIGYLLIIIIYPFRIIGNFLRMLI